MKLYFLSLPFNEEYNDIRITFIESYLTPMMNYIISKDYNNLIEHYEYFEERFVFLYSLDQIIHNDYTNYKISEDIKTITIKTSVNDVYQITHNSIPINNSFSETTRIWHNFPDSITIQVSKNT